MDIKDVERVISDIRTLYLLQVNKNYKERLYEAYEHLKNEGVNSLEEFKESKNLKMGAFTYDEMTIFDRIKDEKYKTVIGLGFSKITSPTLNVAANNPNYGDQLASWGTLGETPYREDLINNGNIRYGLTEEEMKRYK